MVKPLIQLPTGPMVCSVGPSVSCPASGGGNMRVPQRSYPGMPTNTRPRGRSLSAASSQESQPLRVACQRRSAPAQGGLPVPGQTLAAGAPAEADSNCAGTQAKSAACCLTACYGAAASSIGIWSRRRRCRHYDHDCSTAQRRVRSTSTPAASMPNAWIRDEAMKVKRSSRGD